MLRENVVGKKTLRPKSTISTCSQTWPGIARRCLGICIRINLNLSRRNLGHKIRIGFYGDLICVGFVAFVGLDWIIRKNCRHNYSPPCERMRIDTGVIR